MRLGQKKPLIAHGDPRVAHVDPETSDSPSNREAAGRGEWCAQARAVVCSTLYFAVGAALSRCRIVAQTLCAAHG